MVSLPHGEQNGPYCRPIALFERLQGSGVDGCDGRIPLGFASTVMGRRHSAAASRCQGGPRCSATGYAASSASGGPSGDEISPAGHSESQGQRSPGSTGAGTAFRRDTLTEERSAANRASCAADSGPTACARRISVSKGIDWLCDRFKVALVEHDAGEIGGPVRPSDRPSRRKGPCPGPSVSAWRDTG